MNDDLAAIPVVRCRCVPPGQMYVMASNPCTWPECVNGDQPDPADGDHAHSGHD